MTIKIKYRPLKAFLLAVEAHSFTRAAQRLGVTQPSFTALICDLEDSLELQLFERTTRRIALTNAGQDFHDRILRPVTDLEEAYRVACKARDNVYSIGVGLSGATIPGEDKPIFTLADDEMEYGLGIHGEPGVRRVKLQTADEIVEELVEKILEDSGIQAGDTVCTLVNGLGCGFIITFFYDIIAGWFGPAEQLPIQLLWVVIAVPVTAFGCSLYQTADLGVAPYDSLALALQDHLHKPYFGCRVFTDALCAAITFLLGGLVGIGTLVCAFGLGPFIQFFNGAFSEKVLQYKPVETS